MPQLTPQDIRKLTPTERKKKLAELYNELTTIQVELTTGGGTDNPYKTRAVKKAIARILTIEREEELGVKR
ncbi:MAG: 50S ribosomal protein L29 [Candidatus Thorarchaeota archaeon]